MMENQTIFRNIVFDILLLTFVILLISSPVWFDIKDITYDISGLLDYANRNLIPHNISDYWILIPIGIIGIWRWSVWTMKKIISLGYSPIAPPAASANSSYGRQKTSLSIITPVYNEDPRIFRMGLESWWKNSPNEIIAVIDKSDVDCIKEFEDFQIGKSNVILIITSKPGKRAALVDGILKAKGEILALTDSDTIWGKHVRENALAPFLVNPKIGGVTPRYHPISRNSIWQKMNDIFWDMRNYYDMPAQTAAGNALSCISGKTAFYRRDILLSKFEPFLNEVILNRKKESGEDKCLTRLVQSSGWKTQYQSNAVIYSSAAFDFKTFIKQRLRWSRNSHNSDFISLWQGWAWGHPFLAFWMLDRFISTFTLFLGPIFFSLALYHNQWFLATSIIILWIVGRGIKIYPHINRYPRDVIILPVYIFISFLIALTKLYALVTIRDQHVIRGKNVKRKLFKTVKNFILTGEIIFGLFLLAALLH